MTPAQRLLIARAAEQCEYELRRGRPVDAEICSDFAFFIATGDTEILPGRIPNAPEPMESQA